MIWKRLLIFLSLFFVFGSYLILSPSQAQAYDITTNVTPTGKAWEWGSGTGWLQTMSANGETNLTSTGDAIFWGSGFNNSFLSGTWVLKSIVSGNNINFIEGNYYKTQISFNVVGYNAGTPPIPVGVQIPIVNRLVLPSNSPYKLVQIQPYELQCFEAATYNNTMSGSTGVVINGMTSGCYRGTVVYDIIVQATRTATGKLQLGDGASWFFQSFVGINYPSGYGTLRPLTITEYKPDNASVINEEQQQAGEQAQQDGQTGSNQSQSDATQASTSLLGAFSGFVGAITAISPSNCNITGNFGHLDIGTLNFCQDSPPAFVATILSLISVALLVPLSIHLAKRMIGLFRSFTNG